MTFTMDNPLQFTSQISQYMRPHVWFAYVSACHLEDESIGHREAMKKALRVKFTTTFMNGDDHFGSEDYGLYTTHVIVSVILLGSCAVWRKRITWDDVHPIIYLLLAAIACEVLANLFEILHLTRYTYNGIGWKFFDFLHQFFMWGGKFVLVIIFSMVGWGWTITCRDFEPFLPVFVPVCMFVAMAHVMLILLAYLFEQPEKFHDHETVPGYLLIGLRIILFFSMMYGVRKTLGGYKVSSSAFGTLPITPAKRSFLLRFTLFASLWFLALPVVTVISSICAPYVRHQVVSITVMVFQTLVLCGLAHMFLSPGEYKNVSTISGAILGGF